MTTWTDYRTADVRSLFDVKSDACASIQSQYSASENMTSVIAGFARMIDPYEEIQTFYDDIFNIMSAQGQGLDIWGEIIDIPRVIQVNDASAMTLDDDHYRALLLYKALANISSSDIATLNKLLQTLIDTDIGVFNGNAYVLETGPMKIRWVFEYFLNEVEMAIFKTAGTLARGAGVGWEMYAVDPDKVLGFDGSRMKSFNQAPFVPDDALFTENNS